MTKKPPVKKTKPKKSGQLTDAETVCDEFYKVFVTLRPLNFDDDYIAYVCMGICMGMLRDFHSEGTFDKIMQELRRTRNETKFKV